MYANQRTEFNNLIEVLFGAFNMPLSDARKDAYWQGLAKMSLGQFSSVVDYSVGQNGPEKIPSAPGLWKILSSIRSSTTESTLQRSPAGPDQPYALKIVNGLFMKYLAKRRLTDRFSGDLDVIGRRAECLKLVDWISDWTEEEQRSEYVEIKRLFDLAMSRVQDKAA
jgi:hypothetical protein